MTDQPSVVDVDVLVVDRNSPITPAEVQKEIYAVISALKERKIERLSDVDAENYEASKGEGVGVVETIVIAFAGALAKEVATTLWKEVIWPSVKLRLGNKVKSKTDPEVDAAT